MLQFVLELGDILDDSLALAGFLRVGACRDGAVDIVDGTGLLAECLQITHKVWYETYEYHGPPISRRNVREGRLIVGAVWSFK